MAFYSTDSLLDLVETLNDIVVTAPTLENALSAGLEKVLQLMDRAAGAIYVPIGDSNALNPWTTINLSETWKNQINDASSPVHLLAERAIAFEKAQPGDDELDLAGAFPLLSEKGPLGVLLIQGPLFTNEELILGDRLARPLGRSILGFRSHKPDVELTRDLAAIRIFTASINPDPSVHDVQLWILRGIKELFKSEAAALILLDSDNGELAFKKTIREQAEWHSQEILGIDASLALDCVRGGQTYFVEDISDDPIFNTSVDMVEGIEVKSVLCAPLISNHQTLGVIEVFNIPELPITENHLRLLTSMSKSLANSIFSLHLIQELKVINADLEASRWELLHSRNTLRALFDSIPASIYIVDRRYKLIAINMSRSERAIQKPSQLVGKKCYEMLYQRTEVCGDCRVRETLQNGRTTNRTERQWVTNDQPVDWEISSFPILDAANVPIQSIVLEQDITEKRRLEANLIQNEKLAAVGQLAAGVAHEINNPLSAIIANTQLLQRDLPKDNLDAQESLKLIEMAGLRASQVVRNLLGFARKEKYEFISTDLNETIQAALSLIQHELVSHPVTLTCDLDENLPRLKASRDHLQGVWINMILNAIDAIDDEPGTIKITSRYLQNEFRIVIEDNGKGIAPERVTRIFEPFFTTKSPGRGTGLGLSVCHRIIKQHGGYIQVESQIDSGTKFTVVLPANEP